MNRETFFRLLQVAVVAPFIYQLSERENGYFRFGLKLVAGSIVLMNIEPLLSDLQPLIKAAANLQAEQARLSAEQRASAIDAEFTEQPAEA